MTINADKTSPTRFLVEINVIKELSVDIGYTVNPKNSQRSRNNCHIVSE